jgi:hypothetical protein
MLRPVNRCGDIPAGGTALAVPGLTFEPAMDQLACQRQIDACIYARKAGINPDELAVQNRSAWVLPMDANGDQLGEMLTLHRQAGLDHPIADAHKGKKRGIDSMCPKGGWCTHRLMGVEQAQVCPKQESVKRLCSFAAYLDASK